MTVSYQSKVTSSTSGGFTRLVFMWKGSLYKLIYRELVVFLACFGALSATYRYALTSAQKPTFEKIVEYCDGFTKLIPLSFILGFYVSSIVARWWQQYMAIPWPDRLMYLLALYVDGTDEYGRMVRRSLMRYVNLSLILVLRSISSVVKRRFPTLNHVVDAGLMTSAELELLESAPCTEYNTYWVPGTWFTSLLKEARKNNRIPEGPGLLTIAKEFTDHATKCTLLWSYDWVSIPLVYTQVVTIATYSYFLAAVMGRQYVEAAHKSHQIELDMYFSLCTVVEFLFYMGLLKVAEELINPFGEDDEDFELNWLVDRHLKVSYLGVDALISRCPPLVKDVHFDFDNFDLPYTEAASAYKRATHRGSVANMHIPEALQTRASSLASSLLHLPGYSRSVSRQPNGSFMSSNLSRTSTVIHLDHQDSAKDPSFGHYHANDGETKTVPWIEVNGKQLNNSMPNGIVQPSANLEDAAVCIATPDPQPIEKQDPVILDAKALNKQALNKQAKGTLAHTELEVLSDEEDDADDDE